MIIVLQKMIKMLKRFYVVLQCPRTVILEKNRKTKTQKQPEKEGEEMFYRRCPDCGAYLDPGEQCSCHEERLIEMERKEKATAFVEKMMKEERNGQLRLAV
jgi:uncharacterized C2H2 Zn-finger protein